MASIEKRNIVTRGKSATKRMEALARETAIVEHKAEEESARYNSGEKGGRYAKDLHLLDKVSDGFRGTIDYKLLGRKTLKITGENEITRERGYRTKVSKITQRDPLTGEAFVTRRETKTSRKKDAVEFDRDGQIVAKYARRTDGSFTENWQRDSNGDLLRVQYEDSRKRRVLGPVSEQLSDAAQAADGKIYRKLTRVKGASTRVFERDEKGKLELLERTGRLSSMRTDKSADRQTATTEKKKLGGLFFKSYSSRLDADGQEIARDVGTHRRLLNKRSATYDSATGKMDTTKHAVGNIYQSSTTYLDEDTKRVTRKLLGVTLRTKLQALSDVERDAQALRSSEFQKHRQLWAGKAASNLFASIPSDGGRQQGLAQAQPALSDVDSLSGYLQGPRPPSTPSPARRGAPALAAKEASVGPSTTKPELSARLSSTDRAPSPYDFSFGDYASGSVSRSSSMSSQPILAEDRPTPSTSPISPAPLKSWEKPAGLLQDMFGPGPAHREPERAASSRSSASVTAYKKDGDLAAFLGPPEPAMVNQLGGQATARLDSSPDFSQELQDTGKISLQKTTGRGEHTAGNAKLAIAPDTAALSAYFGPPDGSRPASAPRNIIMDRPNDRQRGSFERG